jgi:hypothetical protein
MDINELITQGEAIYATKYESGDALFTYEYVNNERKIEWERLCLMFLRTNFPGNPEISAFEKCCSRSIATYCLKQIAILKAFAAITPAIQTADYDLVLSNFFNRFQKIEQQLARRYDGRDTLRINDEYDVQDLLHSLLKLHFDDIRAEEYTPSYAGSSTRMDFLLDDDQIVIEVKKTRNGLNDKKVGEELTLDIAHYKSHPKCKKVYCFVYDKDCFISNPRGLEKDLETQSTSEMTVKVFIRP